MMNFLKKTGIIVLSVLALACADAPTTTDDLTVVKNDEGGFEANFTSGGDSVNVLAAESESGVFDVTFDFTDTVVSFRIDHARGEGDFLPNGEALSASQNRLVVELLPRIANVIPASDSRTLLQDTVYRQTSFMEAIPAGELLVPFHFVSARGWTHISCTCGQQNIGDGYTRQAGKGCGCNGGSGNGCKGRCGQGCGGTSTPQCSGTTAYTRDCARHDYGLASYATASDDYTFAGNNCSCGGACY
jgi:hypothetical protein